VPPFAFVAVDGGNTYWHRQPNGDDPMAMLLDAVPRWLAERGLGGPDSLPFACAGSSMGGFGALLYARRRREHGQPLRAAAGISPALFRSWAVMSRRHAFVNAAEWAALDPQRHLDALGNLPVGVWCGLEDPLCLDGTHEFIRNAKPVVASLTPGGHNDAFYRHSLPDVIQFVGRYLPERPPASVEPASS
jgi:pimeloyl-ACP methyl ester carboxylesterase